MSMSSIHRAAAFVLAGAMGASAFSASVIPVLRSGRAISHRASPQAGALDWRLRRSCTSKRGGTLAVCMQAQPKTRDRVAEVDGATVVDETAEHDRDTTSGSSTMVTEHAHASAPSAAELMKTRGVLLMVAALYGTNFGSIKVMQEQLVPSDAALIRFSFALLALSPFLRTTPKEMWRPGIGIGIWVALGYIVQGVGLNNGSDASTAAFLCSLAVIVCPLLEKLDGKSVSSNTWRAAAMAVAGVGVLEVGGGVQPSMGDLISLLQPIGFGVGFWKIEKVMKDFPGKGKELTAIQLVVVWLASLAWVAADHQGAPDWGAIQTAVSNMNVAASIVWTGLVTTALTVLLQTTSLGVLSSSETTVLYSTEPIWAAAFANVVLGETVGLNTWVGGALIIAACISSSVSPRKLRKLLQPDKDA